MQKAAKQKIYTVDPVCILKVLKAFNFIGRNGAPLELLILFGKGQNEGAMVEQTPGWVGCC